MTSASTAMLTCDMCGGHLALITQTKTETLWNCWECQNPVRETPMIIFREYSELTAEERRDGIETAQYWLRGESALLLPCDITEQCRNRIVSEAQRAEMDRDWITDRMGVTA